MSTDSAIREIRERVAAELSNTAELLSAVTHDLERARQRIAELERTNRQVHQARAEAAAASLRSAAFEKQLTESRRRERELEEALLSWKRRYDQRADDCADLEATLLEQREQHELMKLEVACLREQIEVLESTIALLATSQ